MNIYNTIKPRGIILEYRVFSEKRKKKKQQKEKLIKITKEFSNLLSKFRSNSTTQSLLNQKALQIYE